jgi:hypothetical protein
VGVFGLAGHADELREHRGPYLPPKGCLTLGNCLVVIDNKMLAGARFARGFQATRSAYSAMSTTRSFTFAPIQPSYRLAATVTPTQLSCTRLQNLAFSFDHFLVASSSGELEESDPDESIKAVDRMPVPIAVARL